MDQSENLPKLTGKQEKFCQEYIFDFNGARAAVAAGYSAKTAKEIASENLTKPNVKARIKYLQDNLAETAGISQLMVLQEYQKIAFSSIAHMHDSWIERKEFDKLTDDQKACIQEISTKTEEVMMPGPEDSKIPVKVEFIKIRLYDKTKSLDSIRKMLGWEAPTKVDHTSKGEALTGVTYTVVKPEDD